MPGIGSPNPMLGIGSPNVSRSHITRIVLVTLVAAAVLSGLPGDTTCVMAQSPSCRATCLQEYNQCRLSTKGSPTCDAHYQTCLQSCLVHR